MKDKVYSTLLKNFVVVLTMILTIFTIILSSSSVLAEELTTKAEEPTTPDYSTWKRTELSAGENIFDKYLLIENIYGNSCNLNLGNMVCNIDEVGKGGIYVYDNTVSLFIHLDDTLYTDIEDYFCEKIDFDGKSYFLFKFSSTTATFKYDGNEFKYGDTNTFKVDLTKVTLDSPSPIIALEPTDDSTVEPEEPTDEPIVEPEEPTVEPDEPIVKPDYATWERTEISTGDNVFNKYLLIREVISSFILYIDNIELEFGEVVKGGIEFDKDYNASLFIYLDVNLYAEQVDVSVERINLDGVFYNLIKISSENVNFNYTYYPGNYNGYSQFSANLTNATLNYPSPVLMLVEPIVVPDEPTVEPDEPTDDNIQEDNSSNVVERKDGFIEMVGNTTIKIFRINDASSFDVGVITLSVLGGLLFIALWLFLLIKIK